MDLLIPALLMGLTGAGHCVAMCGGLSVALGFSIPANRSFVYYATMISLGRISGYAVIGLLAGYFTQSVFALTDGNIAYLGIVSSIFMLGVAAHIAGFSSGILAIEKVGQRLFPSFNQFKKSLLPLDSAKKCFVYGLAWGFLPCGLVYTAITLALTASSPSISGLTMLAFGIGTLPTLVGLTAFNSKLNGILGRSWVRFALAGIVVAVAVKQLWLTLLKLQII